MLRCAQTWGYYYSHVVSSVLPAFLFFSVSRSLLLSDFSCIFSRLYVWTIWWCNPHVKCHFGCCKIVRRKVNNAFCAEVVMSHDISGVAVLFFLLYLKNALNESTNENEWMNESTVLSYFVWLMILSKAFVLLSRATQFRMRKF